MAQRTHSQPSASLKSAARRSPERGHAVTTDAAPPAPRLDIGQSPQFVQRLLGNQALARRSPDRPPASANGAAPGLGDPVAFANARIARITSVSTAPSASRVQRWPFKKTKKFKDTEGLLDLGSGLMGEVGVESVIKSGTTLYDPADKDKKKPNPIQTIDKDLKGFFHDLGDSKWTLVRIPYQSLTSKDEIDKLKLERDLKGNKGAGADLVGIVRKKRVRLLDTKFQHKEQKGALFPHDPTPEDVNQRALGDCYFLAALAGTVRTNPGHIKSMVGDNGNGTVSARFYKVGGDSKDPSFQPEYVTVRKSLVVDKDGDAKYQSGDALWPGMIVKAYAAWDGHQKEALPGFKGTYLGVAGGHAGVAWQHILGQAPKKSRVGTGEAPVTGFGLLEDEQFKGDLDITGVAKNFAPIWDRDFTKPRRITWFKAKDDNEVRANADNIAKKLATPSRDASAIMALLTVNLKSKNVTIPTPLMLQSFIPKLNDADANAWVTYFATTQISDEIAEYQKLGSENAKKPIDLEFMFDLVPKMGISTQGQLAIIEYCSHFMDGTPAVPHYSEDALAIFQKISDRLKEKRYVGLSTPDYGKGTGISGGESTDVVPGVAGGHAYTVVSTRSDKDGRLYIRVRNPWGTFGRGYSTDWKGVEVAEGEFDVELSDVRRYFSDIDYSSNIRKTKVDEKSVDKKVDATTKEAGDLLEMYEKNPAPWIENRLRELRGEMMQLMHNMNTRGQGNNYKFSRIHIHEIMAALNDF